MQASYRQKSHDETPGFTTSCQKRLIRYRSFASSAHCECCCLEVLKLTAGCGIHHIHNFAAGHPDHQAWRPSKLQKTRHSKSPSSGATWHISFCPCKPALGEFWRAQSHNCFSFANACCRSAFQQQKLSGVVYSVQACTWTHAMNQL